jgi:hypothetical protein
MPRDIKRWVGRRLLDAHGVGIGRITDVYPDAPGGAWAAVRQRRIGGRTRVVPIGDARSTDHGIAVPFSRDVVMHAPAIESGAPSELEAQRLDSHYAPHTPEAPVPEPVVASTSAVADDAELAEAVAEERYRAEKVSLYKAKMYGAGETSQQHMRELERAHAGAEANLRRVRERGRS